MKAYHKLSVADDARSLLSGLVSIFRPQPRTVLVKTEWLRTGAAVAYLYKTYGFAVSHDQLGRWMDDGKLTKRVTPGGRRIFDSAELDALMEHTGIRPLRI